MKNDLLEINWKRITDIGNLLVDSTQGGDWKQVDALAKSWHLAIEEHFREFPAAEDTANFYRQAIGQILEIEVFLVKNIEADKKKIQKESRLIRTQQLAFNSYALSQS